MGGGYADAVNSGTNAVYVALRALEIEPGAEVIVPAISDPGGVMPVALCNCVPIPADCAPGSYNIGAEQIEARLTARTAAIVVAHISGIPADMDPIVDLARSRGIPVIEDCAQAHGAIYKGRKVGNFGEAAAFSTMFGKHHASGGQGGIVFTRNEELYWKVRQYADRGKPFGVEDAEGNLVAALNCNMDELHAAIGRVQLRKLPNIISRRRRLMDLLGREWGAGLKATRFVGDPPGCEGTYWFQLFHLDTDRLRVDKAGFVRALVEEGAPASDSYFAAPTRMPWYRNRRVFGAASSLPWSPEEEAVRQWPLPNIEATDACHFRINVHEGFSEEDIQDLVTIFEKVERAYLK